MNVRLITVKLPFQYLCTSAMNMIGMNRELPNSHITFTKSQNMQPAALHQFM